MERLEHRHGHHGRAVGVGHDALGRVVKVLRIYLGHYERNEIIHAPSTRVVHYDTSRCGDGRRDDSRRRCSRCAQCDIDAREVRTVGVLDRDWGPSVVEHCAGRPRGREEANLVQREVALLEDLTHDRSGLTSGSDDGDSHGADRRRGVVEVERTGVSRGRRRRGRPAWRPRPPPRRPRN